MSDQDLGTKIKTEQQSATLIRTVYRTVQYGTEPTYSMVRYGTVRYLPNRGGGSPDKGHMVLQIGRLGPVQSDPVPGGQQAPIRRLHLVHHRQILGGVGRRGPAEAHDWRVGGQQQLVPGHGGRENGQGEVGRDRLVVRGQEVGMGGVVVLGQTQSESETQKYLNSEICAKYNKCTST